MDAYLGNSQNRANLFDPPPVLIVADSEAAKVRGRQTVAIAGLRLADVVNSREVAERIRRQGAASALWVELDDTPNAATDEMLSHVADDVSEGRYAAVIATTTNALDRIGRHAFDTSFDIIVDADDMERAAALAVAVSRRQLDESVSEMSGDKQAARLRQLSEEVSRIASTLARLSSGPAAASRRVDLLPADDIPEISAETVRGVIRARRLRSRYFPDDLFADPAWDMLLDLLQAEIAQLRVPVSSLCIAAAVPATTALRWLKTMVQEGLFVRRADPHDGRRVFVELAPPTSQALKRYFAEVGQVAVV
jgi:hypothetical protein